MIDSQPSSTVAPGFARIHYYRPDGNYSTWSIYSWGSSAENNNYDHGSKLAAGIDSYGAYFDIRLLERPSHVGFIVHHSLTGVKDPGTDMGFDAGEANEAWIISADPAVYLTQPEPAQILSSGFSRLQAFWIDRSTVAIQSKYSEPGWTYSLAYSLTANLSVSDDWSLRGSTTFALSTADGLTPAQAKRYPQLSGYAVLRLPDTVAPDRLRQALKGQVVLAAADSAGKLKYLTGLQIAGVLDDLFPYSGPLGTSFGTRGNEETVTIRLWAPTAQAVELLLYDTESGTPKKIPMTEAYGLWTAVGTRAWKGCWFLFQISVYVPNLHRIVQNIVTDPYSFDLALNGTKTRITDLKAPETKPDGWDASSAPYLRSVNDLSVYELHVRDFSVKDWSVSDELRGTYRAFTEKNSNGMRHLRNLAEAGLKAIHLLPTFHFSSVDEDKSTWQSPGDLSVYPPDGPQQQEAIARVKAFDGYNWGYDPVHYLAPSGAYAAKPAERVREYRQMVAALHETGLRVVQDVVFNHTVAGGQDEKSVLDKIVPGYYHRLDADGNGYHTSCCFNTASEHRMMEKLMIDAIVHHAREYKIDAFRFDLMGLHFVSNLQHIQEALGQLTLEKDGIDGRTIYLYGEGWEIGETTNGALGANASQKNIYGTGVGVFNDRVRDGIRGGNPFIDPRTQGFATGLFTAPSTYTTERQNESDQAAALRLQSDWIRVALAGNLRDFTFLSSSGRVVKGSEVMYNGQGAGYTASPVENVNFCSVHDNRTLFDAIQLKAPIPGTNSHAGDSIAMRVRRQVLAMSLIALGQGIPFFQAGDDLLRSKDMDTNSFDSGDWFNGLDFTYESANWGVGLPLASENEDVWPIAQPLLANPALTPKSENIAASRQALLDFLQIRESSVLFRMESLAEIQANLQFLNTGPGQIPGLIVMKLDSNGRDYGAYRSIVVTFNATARAITFADRAFAREPCRLHPVQAKSSDPVVRQSTTDPGTGAVRVPALTTAVFVS